MTEWNVTFPGGKRVAAECAGVRIVSDQPLDAGGEGSAPAPFDMFLAALANCSGYFLLEFCHRRDLSTDGLALQQEVTRDAKTRRVTGIRQVVTLPGGFPEKYQAAALRAAASCSIKKLLEAPPPIEQVLAEDQRLPCS